MYLTLPNRGQSSDGEQVDEVTDSVGEQVQGLDDGLHGLGGLREGEGERGDGEENLARRQDEVLGQQPEHVHRVGAGHLFNVESQAQLSIGIFGLRMQ